MRNSKETLTKIRAHKDKAEEIRKKIKTLEGELAAENRLIKSLDEARLHGKATRRFKKNVAEMVRKQDLVVAALRSVGRITTAGPICDKLADVGVKCHNSEFAATFLEHVRKDKRVIVTRINATKNEYSLREWEK